jgi:basic amino acid/polyamine antiporter, APA family
MNVATKDNQLLKLLGVGFGIAATVGGTIGTGILRKPGPIAEQIGDPVLILILWLAVGFYALLGVFCAIELAVSMPQAGSWYVYARRAFGNYFGFLTGITSWFGTVVALGFSAYTISEFITLIFPLLDANRLMAIVIILLLTGLHLMGTDIGDKIQKVFSYGKAIGLFLFVIICFLYGGHPTMSHTGQALQSTAKAGIMAGVITALQSMFYAFDGWHTATYFTEENKDPAKSLPKAMIIGILLVITIYVLVNAAILYVLPMAQLQSSKLAAATAMEVLFGAATGKYVTIFLLISILGMANAQVMFAPRVIYSMGRDGLFGVFATKVNKLGTPYLAMVTTSLCSVAFILSGKDTCSMLSDIATFFFVMSYTAGFVSLIKLRKTEPNLPRPYKTPFYPYIPVFLIITSTLFLIGAVINDRESSKYGLLFLVFSYPIYLVVKKLNTSNKQLEKA